MRKLATFLPPAQPLSSADREAHAAASHVRTVVTPEPTQVPPLPTEPRARRRELTRRGW